LKSVMITQMERVGIKMNKLAKFESQIGQLRV
jgi:hypothetical protein